MALVIDTSYYIFYRYFATARWATHADITEREKILAAFERHFYSDLNNWKATGADIYFCLDCPREQIWRREIFPEYKKGRVTSESFDTNAFPTIYSILDEKIDGIHICKGARLEADDCAYLIVSDIIEKTPEMRITVITNDNDYLQMDDRVSIQNMQGEDIRARALKKLNAKTAAECLLMKILMGDKSDEIPPVCAGIGPKTAEKLVAMSEADRMAFLTKKMGCPTLVEAAIKRNKTIISFEEIPIGLRKIDLKIK